MTREIAERIVKGITDIIEANTADMKGWAEYWGFTIDEYEDFLDMAIQAIQKQIPQAVYLTGDGEYNGQIVYDTAQCQSCGFTIDESDSDWEANYCPECGQRWKWEIEQEA